MPAPAPQPILTPLGPPEEDFWEKYNNRMEFPLSSVTTVLLHVLVGALIVFALVRLAEEAPDRSSVPIQLIDGMVDGSDEAGDGMAGSGGDHDLVSKAEGDPLKAPSDQVPTVVELPNPVAGDPTTVPDNPGNRLPKASTTDFSKVDANIQKNTPGSSTKTGSGAGEGTGSSGAAGRGSGTGADSTAARRNRWVIRLRTSGGDDYIDQLHAMGAVIMIPVPNKPSETLLFSNLSREGRRTGRPFTADDARTYAGRISFQDDRAGSVRDVAFALGLNGVPSFFTAKFPEALEKEMEQKERSYRSRDSAVIDHTYFRIAMRGGKYELTVDDQTVK